MNERPGPTAALSVSVEISPAELIDKITILRIKSERIDDTDKRANVAAELARLSAVRDGNLPRSDDLDRLTAELKAVNDSLWQIEDDIRDCERAGDFGARFIELARAVYRTNDNRMAVKRRINELLGSAIVEEKSYAAY